MENPYVFLDLFSFFSKVICHVLTITDAKISAIHAGIEKHAGILLSIWLFAVNISNPSDKYCTCLRIPSCTSQCIAKFATFLVY